MLLHMVMVLACVAFVPKTHVLGWVAGSVGERLNQLDAADDGLPASSAAAAVLSGEWEQCVACSDF